MNTILDNNIINKINNLESLTKKERTIIETIFSEKILSNYNFNDTDKLLLHNYCTNYISKEEKSTTDKIILICYDLVQELNKKYKKDFSIEFINKPFSNMHAFVKLISSDNVLRVNVFTFLRDYKLCKIIPHYKIKTVSFFMIFTILHEYTHLLQNHYLIKHDDEKTELFIKENIIMKYFRKFYMKNHEYFNFEEEANIFALSTVLDYFGNYFTYDDEFQNEMVNKYYCAYIVPFQNKEEFNEAFNKLYNYLESEYPEGITEFIKEVEEFKSDKTIPKV